MQASARFVRNRVASKHFLLATICPSSDLHESWQTWLEETERGRQGGGKKARKPDGNKKKETSEME